MKVYDHSFNANEWFIIICLIIGISIVIFLPKRFTSVASVVFFMCGVYNGFFFDHSLSVMPVSFYDVNDSSRYQFMDFLSYWGYGAFSYLFFYIYDALKLPSSRAPIYILLWSLFSVSMEWWAVKLGVFHYNNGYKIFYSFPIYLIVQTGWVIFYNRYKQVIKTK